MYLFTLVRIIIIFLHSMFGPTLTARGVWWPSGRVSDSGARGWGFTTYLRRVVSLSKDAFTPRKVMVIPRKRWLRPDMTEKLLTGTLSINTNKQTNSHSFCQISNVHTVYPVTPNAGMFYQRGCKHLRRGNTQDKKTCN